MAETFGTDKTSSLLKLAKHLANIFSDDPHTKVGAVFYDENDDHVLAIGYNRSPEKMGLSISNKAPDNTGISNCKKLASRPEKYEWIEHAERNGIFYSSKMGISLKGTTCYVTMAPCVNCTRALIQAGIQKVVYIVQCTGAKWEEEMKVSKRLLTKAKVEQVPVDLETIFTSDSEKEVFGIYGWQTSFCKHPEPTTNLCDHKSSLKSQKAGKPKKPRKQPVKKSQSKTS
jgi:dCMP deaminase